jgi:outer membrane protein assembly factor BamB
MRNCVAVAIGYSLLLLIGTTSLAQPLPPCGAARPTTTDDIWSGAQRLWCVEIAISPAVDETLGYVDIAAASQNSLYAVSPTDGTLIHVVDTNADRLPDQPIVLHDGLLQPSALAITDESVFVATRGGIYRNEISTGELERFTDNPNWRWDGYPVGGMTVHNDQLYVGIGADTACSGKRGAIWRYDLDGSASTQVASGLVDPGGIAVLDEVLYVSDRATDRLWLLEENADYGACTGNMPESLLVHEFETGATPSSIASYTSNLFPITSGRLLVALRGSLGQLAVHGFRVVAISPEDNSSEEVLPRNPAHLGISEQRLHVQGSGFYPQFVNAVSVSEEGWIYISTGDGAIYALREHAGE